MSNQLYELAKRFADGEISAEAFADLFMERWKQQRDAAPNMDTRAPNAVCESLSTIFCLADLFHPEADREEYELDETRLRFEVRKALGL